jgi:PAS domain S-box-containing protein
MAMKVSRSGAWDWDILKNTFYWSDEFLQIFGLPENTIAGFEAWTHALHPDDIEMASARIQEAIENHTELLNDYRIILPNKELRWIRATGLTTYLNNKPERMIGLCIDITNQKTAEKELLNAKERAEESEAIVKASMENSQAGIVIAEYPTGKLKYSNKAALLIRGKEYDELVKDVDIEKYVSSWQILHFDGTPYQTDEVPLTRAIRYGETISREFIVRRENNEDRYVWANAAPIYNAQGIQTSAIVIFLDITDRKQAEQANQKLEEEQRFSIYGLNTAQSLARMGSWKWDMKNDKVLWSDEMYHIFGIDKYSHAGLLRNVIKSVIHPDDLHVVLPENAAEFAKNEINEYRIILPDNSIRHIQAKAGQTEFDTEGNPVFFSGIAQDITERKKLEDVHTFLSTSGYPGSDENFFESLAKYLAEILDSEYVCIDKLEGDGLTAQTVAIYNEGKFEPNVSYTLKQTPCGDVVGKAICCFPENVCQLFPHDEALQDLKAHSYIGTTLWSFAGKPIGLIAIIGQKPLRNTAFAESVLKLVAIRAAGELERKNLEKIREILYNIATAVVTSDSVEQLLEFVRTQLSQIVDTTNFFAALYNAKNNKLKKLHWVDDVDDFVEWDAAKSFSGYVVKTGKMLLLNKQEIAKLGAEQDIPVIGAPAESWLGVPLVVDKKTIGVLVIQSYSDPKAYDASSAMLFEQIAYDLSVFIEKARILQDLKVAKAQAVDSDRLKSAFLANMSHEIRTPMNGILGFAELLKTPGLSGEEQQQYIKIIEKSGARMLNIINDIVDISKIEAGLMKVDIRDSNINEQIEYIFTFFKPEVEAKGMKISFRNSLPAKEAIIKTDREKLYAILTNLVKNAIKYTNKGSIEFGYILVDSVNSPSVQFYVKDTGIGIPPDRQGPIFERFIQADITDKMARQGAGLGLSITKAYVEMLGGKIWVESRLGMGSTFFFTLPYHADPIIAPVNQQLTPEGTSKNVRKLKILIAEDDETSEMLMDIIVKTFGKQIIKARSGVEAVEACRNNPDLDLILMDIRMPEMDGYKATLQIREFNKEVVIIAQTAYGLTGDKEKAIESGCNDYISKPVSKDELFALIEIYFN